jgi:hypothetical protein
LLERQPLHLPALAVSALQEINADEGMAQRAEVNRCGVIRRSQACQGLNTTKCGWSITFGGVLLSLTALNPAATKEW